VVLAVDDEDALYVEEALDSLAGQTHAWFTTVVAPFGDCRGVLEVVRRRAWADTRIVPLRTVSSSRGAAYDRGARRARTPYLMFMDGRDVLPTRSLEQLVGTITTTGSDLVVGLLEQAPQVVRSVAAAPPAHRDDQLGVTVDRFPAAITDTHEQNRLYRSEFWRSAGLGFTDPSGERTPAVDAYFAASAFDVIKGVTYVRMNRSPGSPFGQEHDSFAEFDNWLAGQEAMVARLDAMEASAAANLRDSWLSAALEEVSDTLLEDVERATDEQWTSLREHVALAVGPMSEESWRQMAAEAKVRITLLLDDRRAELTRFVAARWFQYGNRPTEVRDGRVYAALPFFGDESVGLDDDTFEMSESETPLRAVLRSARWDGDAALELGLVAYIDFVDLDATPEVRVDLVDVATGERLPLDVGQRTDATFAQRAQHRFQNFDRGGLSLRLDSAWLGGLAEKAADGRREWVLDLAITHRGVTRRGPVTGRDERGTGGMLQQPATAPRSGVELVADDQYGVRIRAGLPREVVLDDVTVSGHRLVLAIRADVPLTELVASHPESAPVTGSAAGAGPRHEVVLELPTLTARAARTAWQLEARASDGRRIPVWFPAGRDGTWLDIGGDLVVGRSSTGGVEVLETASTVVLDRCELGDDGLTVHGHWLGRPAEGSRLELRGRRATVAADVPATPSFRTTLSTRWDPWGLRETRIPWDEYSLALVVAGSAGRLLTSAEFDDHLLDFQVDEHYRMRTSSRPGISLYPALADDERGAYHQERLKIAARTCTDPIDPHSVYLQAYGGLSATDSQLAIHEELTRSHPELTLHWGVLDSSAWVPPGAVPLLINSREWYHVLSTAKYLATNLDLPRWFRKREGQHVLQTFHGYPSKAMGIGMWRAKNFTPMRIEAEVARTSAAWDLILTPSPEMDRYYREEYRYEGAIHSHGYPRDDVLVSDRAERIREETRARLGIRPGQVAVLYAPTWRDDMAGGWRRASLVTHLDIEAARAALGDDYVFLLRGHRFHLRAAGRTAEGGRAVDVTDYPEVNDLILAADVAVLDYSSLRFDFSLTGRPMVFLVPDLADYAGGVRGFLYDFAESAPGPLLDTTDEVVGALRDLDGLRDGYADAYAAFQARFNRCMDGTSTRRVVEAFFDGTGDRDR
jgi:CDP-glycerol glycerophosphotransferase